VPSSISDTSPVSVNLNEDLPFLLCFVLSVHFGEVAGAGVRMRVIHANEWLKCVLAKIDVETFSRE
jgi:hypothetical protein